MAFERRVRKAKSREEEPSLAILDSKSAKAEKGRTGASTGQAPQRAQALRRRGLARPRREHARESGERGVPTRAKALLRDLAENPRLRRLGGRSYGGSPMADLARSQVEVEMVATEEGGLPPGN